MVHLTNLPSELLSLIFDHVDNEKNLFACLLVNKQLYREIMPVLWKRLDATNKHKLTNMITTLATSQHTPGHYMRSVVLGSKITETQFLTLMQHVPLLEHLDLYHGNKITDNAFQQVPRNCPHLISICINNAKITQLSMLALSQHCHQLRQIDLMGCHGLDADLFAALHSCPLEEISIVSCHLDGINDPEIVTSARLALAGFSALTSLKLFEVYNDCDALLFTTTTETSHAIVWPRLTHLSLNTCFTLDDTKAIKLIQAHPQLVSFQISGSNITDHTLDAIPLYLPNIMELMIAFSHLVTASGLYRLVKRCTKLEGDGVACHGCRIYPTDPDFPSHLDNRFYRTEHRLDGRQELSWLTSDAFESHNHPLKIV